jgi:hypothetical protein
MVVECYVKDANGVFYLKKLNGFRGWHADDTLQKNRFGRPAKFCEFDPTDT